MPVIINGTTGLSGVSTVNLANGSVTQNILANGVAGTGPAFSAYQSSGQTPSSGVFTKILFQTEDYDTANNFADSRFTPNVAGYYFFTGEVQFATSSYSTRMAFYKNGSLIGYGSSGTVVTSGSFLIYLNGTTDYAEIYAATSTSQATVSGVGITFFQGFLARAA